MIRAWYTSAACLCLTALLWFAGSSAGQEDAPHFVLQTLDGAFPPAPLEGLDDKWALQIGDKKVRASTWVALRRDKLPLPACPSPPYLSLTSGDVIALLPGAPLHVEEERLFFQPQPDLTAGRKHELSVPLAYVAFLVLAAPDRADDFERMLARLKKGPRPFDTIVLKNGDRIEGSLQTFKVPGQVAVNSSGRMVQAAGAQIAVLAPTTELRSRPRSKQVHALVTLTGGSRVHCLSLRLDPARRLLTGKALAGPTVEIKLSALAEVSLRQGPTLYLSDLKPLRYEHEPFLSLSWPLGVDESAAGLPLRLGQACYSKGLGMHPRARVTYQTKGYAWFEATVGLDARSGPRAQAVVSILLDGQAATEPKTVRASAAPLHLRLDIRKAKTLTLITDFGNHGDVEADVNWTDARLVPAPPKESP